MSGPLEGLKIIEIGEGPAVAYTGVNLADMGAEVVKIEPPEGNGMRRWPSAEVLGAPAVFHVLNRGKASLALDLTSDAGRSTLASLLYVADAVVDGTEEGIARILAPDADAPSLVVARITPYGEGVAVDVPAHDATIQAESGWMSINGRADFTAVRSGLPMPSVAAGATAAQAILAALIAGEDDGIGEDIDIALYDQAHILTYHYAMQFLINGERSTRYGNGSPAAAPLGVFEASDGEFQMTAAGDRVWKRLVENVLERPELLEDPRFTTNADRIENLPALMEIVEGIFRSDTREHWITKMQAGGVPGGPIRNLDEAAVAPESVERGLIVSAKQGGGVPAIRNPMRFRDTPLADPKPAPVLDAGGSDAAARWAKV